MQNDFAAIARDHDWYWQITGKTRPNYAQAEVVIVPTVIIMLLLWGIALMAAAAIGITTLVLVVSLFASTLLAISMEAYYILLATHRVTTLITSRHWDLVRLTPVRPEIIFANMYVTIELRCFKAMVVEVAFRILAITSALGLLLVGGNNSATSLFVWIPLCCPAAVVFGLVVIEPFWLLPTLVALGIAVGARIKQFLFAVVVGIALITAQHILRAAFVAAVILVGLQAGNGELTWLCCAPLGVAILALGTYALSNLVRYQAVRYAQWQMFRPE